MNAGGADIRMTAHRSPGSQRQEAHLQMGTILAICNQCSHDIALRDILPLVKRGILVRNPEGGRSTSYALSNIPSGS